MPELNAAKTFKCNTCLTTFRRHEHLKRHAATAHTADRSFACEFCTAKFKRGDALRRHYKSCSLRVQRGVDMPPAIQAGRRKRACESCTTLKRACDLRMPCLECAERRKQCIYRRGSPVVEARAGSEVLTSAAEQLNIGTEFIDLPFFGIDYGHSGGMPYVGDLTTLMPAAEHPPQGIQRPIRLQFLLNFTRTTGVNSSYNYKRPSMQPQSLVGVFSYGTVYISKGAGICRLLESATRTTGTGTAHPANINFSQITSAANNLFSIEEMPKLLAIFWERWYPHCPIVHRSSFNLAFAHPLLITAMILLGAVMSPFPHHREQGRLLLDSAENAIFSSKIFDCEGYKDVDEVHNSGAVATFQAAYFICIMQKWEGNEVAKQRIRRHRFTALVSAVRSLGIPHATHKHDLSLEDPDEVRWKKFIRREELIRIVSYAFLLDCGFLTFHNCVPRMALQEMTNELPCLEVYFQAATASEFFELTRLGYLSPRVLTLVEALRLLTTTPDSMFNYEAVLPTSSLSLFVAVNALLALVYHQRTLSVFAPSDTQPLLKAIYRWEDIWEWNMYRLQACNIRIDTCSGEGLFMQQAPEFAALARLQLNTANSEINPYPYPSGSLLPDSGFCIPQQKLDKSDMSHLADLILRFEAVNMGQETF
ncbi:hypothetical protein F5Y00DRAFT_232137 [Daldinia vernicosa]|uniref:uncharacterized protein n=1 Tax=Daldinia vernicosa TaxID=114800 RepID=UPI002007ECA5|nr:uncharacterized protein F5Y00DRAFT_232137 [Daldinia vernicosa]KAI0850816.1 hypothetical protein F5Y00DRAFT_232137 [Daldinia vernicosa]